MGKSKSIVALAIFLLAASYLGAQAKETISLMAMPGGGYFLVDAKGMALYYYTKDSVGLSACYGGCATSWPIFYAPTVIVPPTLKASDFATITRTDGTLQTTYRGWPLYYWMNDIQPGDITGEGRGKVWYVIDPAKFPPPKI